jgi:hypothetical protein
MRFYRELPPKYNREAISVSAGVIKNSMIAHYYFKPRLFLIGGNFSGIGIEIYLGFWYFNIYW